MKRFGTRNCTTSLAKSSLPNKDTYRLAKQITRIVAINYLGTLTEVREIWMDERAGVGTDVFARSQRSENQHQKSLPFY